MSAGNPLSDLGDLSKLVTNHPEVKKMQDLMQMKNMLIEIVGKDNSLSAMEREQIHQKLQEPGVFERLMHGAIGASIAFVLSRFLHLSKETQMIMGLLGFGVGGLLKNALGVGNKHPDYDAERKTYAVR